jgi:hypothetical protein
MRRRRAPATAAPSPRRQTGVALLLILLIAMTVGLSLLFASGSSGGRFLRQQDTEDALATAKAALIGHAASYKEQYSPDRSWGYLPCADTNNNGDHNTGFGECPTGSPNVMGRFPYLRLRLDALRDSHGECLWYAVSASHKTANDTSLMNWDLRGNLRIEDANGAVLADPADAAGGAAAVVFSPGPPLATQARSGGNNRCPGDSSNSVTAWLDDPGYAPTVAGTLTVRQGSPGSATNNDQLAWVTPKELWDAIARRIDLLGSGSAVLAELAACLNAQSSLPLPATAANKSDLGGADANKWRVASAGIDQIIGGFIEGAPPPPPALCAFSSPFVADLWSNWKDHVRYVVCKNGSPCLSVTPPSGPAQSCTGALLFGGRKANGLPRTAAERASLDSYFEDPNRASLNGSGTAFSGPTAYDPANPAQDLALCLNPVSPPPPVTFGDGVSTLAARTFADGRMVSFVDGTLTLGDEDLETDRLGVSSIAQLFGCAWVGGAVPFANGFRAYFRFLIEEVGEGFVFAVIDADRNPDPNVEAVCGAGGQRLGYAGVDTTGGFVVQPIAYPKIGVEFDTRAQPAHGDGGSDSHLAVLYWGDRDDIDDDNVHGAGSASDPTNPARVDNEEIKRKGRFRDVRVEVTPNSPSSVGLDGLGSYRVKVWVHFHDASANPGIPSVGGISMNDTTVPFPESGSATMLFEPQLLKINNLPPSTSEVMKRIRFGFTNSASDAEQVIRITNFQARSIP